MLHHHDHARSFVTTLRAPGAALGFSVFLLGACAGPRVSTNKAPTSPPPAPAPPSPRPDAPPPTRRTDTADTLFGERVADPYRWLEDDKSAEVRAWMGAQDHYAREHLEKLPRREALAARLKALYYVESISAPVHRGDHWFYYRTHADREKAIVYVREGKTDSEGRERVLLDPNALSTDGTVSLGALVPSWDGRRVAYTLRTNASDESVLHVLDVATGKESLADRIEGAKYAHPAWTPSGDGFYYTWVPPIGLPLDGGKTLAAAERPGYAEVRFHKLGTPAASDVIVYPRTNNPERFLGVDLSRDGRYLLVSVSRGWTATDVYFRELRPGAAVTPGTPGTPRTAGTASTESAFLPLVVGKDALYNVEAWKDRFYVHTNEDAPRYRLYSVDPRHPARAEWKEIVAESPANDPSVIESVQIIGGHIVLARLRNASSELEVRKLDGAEVRKVNLPGIGAVHGMTGNADEDGAYFSFHSFTQPLQVRATSIRSGETSLWAEVHLPIDPSPYTVEQVRYPSRDGTQVSMFIVRRKDLARDGSTPFLLGGYGGFNISMLPGFSAALYPWLEAGGAYALPNLRGGGEYGEAWHRAGMGAQKQNVFDDFIGAAEYLIQNGYTRPARLAIRGGSNGGLLVGAALTQRPDLFGAVVCAVPLLDMVRFHLSGGGKTWVPEYGSPEVEAEFRPLYAYSPYHHIKAEPTAQANSLAMPPVLMLSADSDDRVDPLHARKMTAALQQASNSPVWLRIEKHAGHGGADLVKQAVEQSTDVYAFLMNALEFPVR